MYLSGIQSLFPVLVLSIFGSIAITLGDSRHSSGGQGGDGGGSSTTELEKLELTEEELLQDLEDLHRIVRRGTEDLTRLNCPPCDRLHCSPRKASKLTCKGGVTLGVCNCCPRCAKIEGERCGGKWNYLGRCDQGTECVPDSDQGHANTTPQGVCRRISIQPDVRSDQAPEAQTCRPKCTAEFCKGNPKAICSAVDNADVLQHCQGQCQHTSCLACQFVADEPDCGRCSRDDFRCIRRYAKCLRRSKCSKQQFPCYLKDTQESTGKFQCRVPQCSTGL
ncbi:uncharacterized protein [Diadema antillarum]|uniref:uncharacterized protein n=1 Tax=Diadema antillarum TaxID=105358 RepID=UPI003A8921B7